MTIDTFVDTHVHVACADQGRFPRRPTGVGSAWWSEPSGRPAAVLATARTAGASRAIVVQAVGAYGHDSSCAEAAVLESDGFAELVISLDMSALDDGMPTTSCVGWRLFGVSDGAPWLDDGRADDVWQAARSAGVVIVPTIFTDRLDGLRRAIGANPDVPVALDHCAFPDMGGATGERAMLDLADVPAVRLKVTTHVLDAWEREHRLDDMFERIVAAFGVERMCWGSDHPQQLGSTYAEKVALAERASRNLDDDERRRFFSGTAASLGWS